MTATREICRATPFYGEWNLVGRFVVIEAGALRRIDHAQIDRFIGIRRHWRDRYRSINPGGSWRHDRSDDITDQDVRILHDICDMLHKETRGHKLMICGDWIYVYTNSPDLLDDFARMAQTKMQVLGQIKIQGSPHTVNLRSSDHAWRSFFRDRKIEKTTIDSVVAFLGNQSDVRLSPALKHCITQGWSRFERWYFIDHNDQAIITCLSLISPGIIRKTVPIATTDK